MHILAWGEKEIDKEVENEMRVCIPTMGYKGMEEQIGEHFGRVPTYTVVDLETGEVKIIENTSEHMGGQGLPPEIIAGSGADILLCAGLGHRAISMFEELGIMVYVNAYGTVRDALLMLKDGRLQPATDENACKKHTCDKEESHNHN